LGEVKASFGGNPNYVAERDLLAGMTGPQRRQVAELNSELTKLNQRAAALEEAGAAPQDPWQDLAQAMFSLKEFIYLQ
jgi:sensor domain CHASE-containing protein